MPLYPVIATGENRTVTMQLPPTGTAAQVVGRSAKTLGSDEVTVGAASATSPVFVTVTGRSAVAPTVTVEKLSSGNGLSSNRAP
jgi:hypothetical protein